MIIEALRMFTASELSDDDKLALLGSNAEWFNWKVAKKKPRTAKVHDILKPFFKKKKERIGFLSFVFEREMESTKDLRVGEFFTIIKAEKVKMITRAAEEYNNVKVTSQ